MLAVEITCFGDNDSIRPIAAQIDLHPVHLLMDGTGITWKDLVIAGVPSSYWRLFVTCRGGNDDPHVQPKGNHTMHCSQRSLARQETSKETFLFGESRPWCESRASGGGSVQLSR